MIEYINGNPEYWKNTCYIASKVQVIVDDDDNEISVYSEPIKYKFNYQPISSDADFNALTTAPHNGNVTSPIPNFIIFLSGLFLLNSATFFAIVEKR